MGIFYGTNKVEWYFYSPAYMENGYYEKEPYGKKKKAMLDKELTRSFLIADGKGSPRLKNLYSHIQNANTKHHQELVRKSDNSYLALRMSLPNGKKLDLSAVYPLDNITLGDINSFYESDKRLNIASIKTMYKIDNRRKRFPKDGSKDTDYLLGAYQQSKPSGSKFADVCQYLDLKPFFYKELREHKMWQRYIYGVLKFFAKMCIPARLLKDAEVFQYQIPFINTPTGGGENGAEIMRSLNNCITLRMLKKENIPGKPSKICFLGCEPDKNPFPGLFIYYNKYNDKTDTYTQLALDLSLFFGESINTNLFGLIDSDGLNIISAMLQEIKTLSGAKYNISVLAPPGVAYSVNKAIYDSYDKYRKPVIDAIVAKLNTYPMNDEMIATFIAEQDKDFYESILNEFNLATDLVDGARKFNELVANDVRNLPKYKPRQEANVGCTLTQIDTDTYKQELFYKPVNLEYIDMVTSANMYRDRTIRYIAIICANELAQGVKSKFESKLWYQQVMKELEANNNDIAKLRENYNYFKERTSITDDSAFNLELLIKSDLVNIEDTTKEVNYISNYNVDYMYLDGYPIDYVVTGTEPVERVKCKLSYIQGYWESVGDKNHFKYQKTELGETTGWWHDEVYDNIPIGYPQFGIGEIDESKLTQLQTEYNEVYLAHTSWMNSKIQPVSPKDKEYFEYIRKYKELEPSSPFYDRWISISYKLAKYNKDSQVNWSTYSASTNPLLRMPVKLWRSIPYCAKKEVYASTIWLAIHGETNVKYEKGLLKVVKIVIAVVIAVLTWNANFSSASMAVMAKAGAVLAVASSVASAFGNKELAKTLGYMSMIVSVVSLGNSLTNIGEWGFKEFASLIFNAGTTITNLVIGNRARNIQKQINQSQQEIEKMSKEKKDIEEQMGDVFYGISTTKCYEDMGANLELANSMINEHLLAVYSLAYEYPDIIYNTKGQDPFS